MTRFQEANKKLQQTSSFIKFDKSEYKFKNSRIPWNDEKAKSPSVESEKKLDSKDSDDEEEEVLNVLDKAGKQVQAFDRPG